MNYLLPVISNTTHIKHVGVFETFNINNETNLTKH